MVDWLNLSSFEGSAALLALAAVVVFAVTGWLLSLARKDVSIVDSLWSLMFLVSLGTYLYFAGTWGWRTGLMVGLASIWALRLSAHITWRGWGEPEDHRYQEIRANNQPNFKYKSLYIVFGLQAFLAWIISMPMLASVSQSAPLGWFDFIGISLWLVGMFFETVADAQLERFKRNPDNRGKVLRSGLWRYTRHPNYFGEFVLQWGFFFIAISAGGAWTIFAPLLISFLLLRVSGVRLMEKDMASRRPEYRDYVESTNAFFPGRPRSGHGHALFVAFVLGIASPWANQPAAADSADGEWNFRVLVNDKEVGNHRFYVDAEGDTQVVRSVADFEYKLLFLTLYEYEHENRELWQDSCLKRIESTTNANGKIYAVKGRLVDDTFVVETRNDRHELPDCVMTFAYWDPAFLNQSRLLNSQTGQLMEVEVTAPVSEDIEVRGNRIAAERYRLLAGEIEIDLWYADGREWIALETSHGEGRSLRYELQ